MRNRKILTGLLAFVALIISAQLVVRSSAQPKSKAEATRFKVRVENISSPDGQTASNGEKWPFALSPGMWVLDSKNDPLFTPGKLARANGLEAQAEDGNPEMLFKSFEAHHSPLSIGFFNMPVGATSPGPITPGNAYEFTFSAMPGMKLTFALMFGQSNDLFYAPEKAIALFDAKGRPVTGDITNKLMLWDAGTEVNQEPGIGADQAPRQKAPNTGQAESKPVGPVRDGFTYPKTNEVLRVIIMPETGM